MKNKKKKSRHNRLLSVVTRTGIGRLARRSLVVGGSDDHLGRHSTPPCSIPCFVQMLIKKEILNGAEIREERLKVVYFVSYGYAFAHS